MLLYKCNYNSITESNSNRVVHDCGLCCGCRHTNVVMLYLTTISFC